MKLTASITGLDQVRKGLGSAFSDRRFATSLATGLTRTANATRDAVRKEMTTVFDQPTAFTLNSMYTKPARADTLEAEVGFKDAAAGGRAAVRYLTPEIRGGARHQKGMEKALRAIGHLPAGKFAVPGSGARIDSHGNMARAQIRDILEQLKGGGKPVAAKGRGKKGSGKKGSAGTYFSVTERGAGLKPGIYRRGAGRDVTPVLLFASQPVYSVRLPFEDIARRTVEQHLGPNIRRAIGESAARLKARG
jgi:hypothetical protein